MNRLLVGSADKTDLLLQLLQNETSVTVIDLDEVRCLPRLNGVPIKIAICDRSHRATGRSQNRYAMVHYAKVCEGNIDRIVAVILVKAAGKIPSRSRTRVKIDVINNRPVFALYSS